MGTTLDTAWRLREIAPEGDVTPYDRRALLIYAELLEADDCGLDWEDGAVAILDVDPHADREAAWRCWTSHLARARWIVGKGLASAVEVFGRKTEL